jgi:predicted SAM-dependent methyltransferase
MAAQFMLACWMALLLPSVVRSSDTVTVESRCAKLAEPTCTEPSPAPLPQLRKNWVSPDPFLGSRGIRYLHIGGDIWNRCHEGWLNIDMAFMGEGLAEGRMGTDDKGAHNMVHRFSRRTQLPFRSQSVQMVYSEHMIEHLLPSDGEAVLREAYRVLVPGGVLRIATPDLEKYLCGYMLGKDFTFGGAPFLQAHARRFAPMLRVGGKQPSDATIVNNIFRNYDHLWIYDYGELVRLAADAGVSGAAVCRSGRTALGLPGQLRRALHRALQPRNASLACWLDQPVREDESLYVHLTKGSQESDVWAQPSQEPPQPACQQPAGWSPCLSDAQLKAQSQRTAAAAAADAAIFAAPRAD